jgi:nucleoside-diphosphate-sugar epimerase
MKKTILVAGATGDLGGKICRELIKSGAHVKALVREDSSNDKTDALREVGAEVIAVNYSNEATLISACTNASCIVSALAGLHDVIVTAQTQLLQAALKAGVARFIPSDFCTDYTQLETGDNRNFDLRKEFQTIIDRADIQTTSIFNGAFAYVLQHDIPLLNTKEKTITYYQDKLDWQIDFTTVDNTAQYTAAAALDDNAPRLLNISSFRVSPRDLATLAPQIFGLEFQLKEQGSMEEFATYIKKVRQNQPEGENQLYPQWQQMQYLYGMFAAHHNKIDNERYDIAAWATAVETLRGLIK